MAQVSYGTITIIDTTDIERIYVVYAKHTSNTNSNGLPAAENWTESISSAPGEGDYIWQRTVIEKTGVAALTYGNPVCVTGPEGAAGRHLASTTTEYTTATNSATITTSNMNNYTWTTNVPSYNSSRPAYWVRITNVYADSAQYTESYSGEVLTGEQADYSNTTTNTTNTIYIIYKDEGITGMLATAQEAATIAEEAVQIAESNINSITRLWFAQATVSPIPTINSVVADGTSNRYGAWSNIRPTDNSAYPYYYYCDQTITSNNIASWSAVTLDTSTLSKYEIEATNVRTKNFFKSKDSSYDGWIASGRSSDNGLNESNAETFFYNARFAANNISLGYNKTPVINLDGSNGTINIYRLPTINSSTKKVTAAGSLGMQLGASSLNFYKPPVGNAAPVVAATLSSTGLNITDGSIQLGTSSSSSTTAGNITLSNSDFNRSINNTSRSNLRFAIGQYFGVTNDGTLYASNADISGTINAIHGSITGDVTIGDSVTIGGYAQENYLNSNIQIGSRNYAITCLGNIPIGTTETRASGVTATMTGAATFTLNGSATTTDWFFSNGKCFCGIELDVGSYLVWHTSENVRERIGYGASATYFGATTYCTKESPYVLNITTKQIYWFTPYAESGKSYSNQEVRLMIEKGNKVTDWSPAPEDVDSGIAGAAMTATNYITHIDNDGIWITPYNSKPSNVNASSITTGAKINADGMTIYKNNFIAASYGSSIVLNRPGTNNAVVTIDSDGNATVNNINAVSGKIGGWNIGSESSNKSLYYSNQIPGYSNSNLVISPYSTVNSNAIAGSDTGKHWFLSAGRNFGVDTNGVLYATGAHISGPIQITSGSNVYDEIAKIPRENLLQDTYAPSLEKVDAKYNRYFSDSSNSTTVCQFIEATDEPLPDPYATHFVRITNTTKGKRRALCFYDTPNNYNLLGLLPGTIYKVGCWVRQLSGDADFKIYIPGTHRTIQEPAGGFVPNATWQWYEISFTFSQYGYNTQTDWGNLYFYNFAGSYNSTYSTHSGIGQIDMCGFTLTKVSQLSNGGRNILRNTKDYSEWRNQYPDYGDIITGSPTAVLNFYELSQDAWRGFVSHTYIDYQQIRNKPLTFSVQVKAAKNSVCTLLLYNRLFDQIPSTDQRYSYTAMSFVGTGEWQTLVQTVYMTDDLFYRLPAAEYGAGAQGANVDLDSCYYTPAIMAINTEHAGFQAKELMLTLGTTPYIWSSALEDVNWEGQNLLKNTATYTDWYFRCIGSAEYPEASPYIVSIDENKSSPTASIVYPSISNISSTETIRQVAICGHQSIDASRRIFYPIIRNKNVTFSCQVKAAANVRGCIIIEYDLYDTEIGGSRLKYTNKTIPFVGTGNWETITQTRALFDETFTLGSGEPTYYSSWIRFCVYRGNINNEYTNCVEEFEIRQLKLEIGEHATDWSANSDDILTDISVAVGELSNSINETLYGTTMYQYISNNKTYNVWQSDGTDGGIINHYYYYNDNNTMTEVQYSALVADEEDSNLKTTVSVGGLVDTMKTIESAIDIDPDEPSITLRLVKSDGTTSNSASQKFTATRWSLLSGTDEIMYADSEEAQGKMVIPNLDIEQSITIGNLKIYNESGGIGIGGI